MISFIGWWWWWWWWFLLVPWWRGPRELFFKTFLFPYWTSSACLFSSDHSSGSLFVFLPPPVSSPRPQPRPQPRPPPSRPMCSPRNKGKETKLKYTLTVIFRWLQRVSILLSLFLNPVFPSFQQSLPSFSVRAALILTKRYWVLPSFSRLLLGYLVFSDRYWVLPSF